jgi:hypothetical protein
MLDEQGLLKPLVKAGLISTKVLLHRDIYYSVDAQMRSGVSKAGAVMNAEEKFKISRATVYNVLKQFK